MIFGLVGAFVLIPLVLISVDAYITATQKAKLQDAIDSATLFAAKSDATDAATLTVLGTRALKANLIAGGAKATDVTAASFSVNAAGRVVGSGTMKPRTVFNWCGVAGTQMCYVGGPLSASSEVVRSVERLEVALVLDNTGSMQGAKLTALKSAAKKMVDSLEEAAEQSTETNPIEIALVPFSNTVRVQSQTYMNKYKPSSHTGPGVPSWIDPEARAHWPGGVFKDALQVKNKPSDFVDRFALLKRIRQPWEGCVESRRPPFDVQETAPSSATPATMFTPYFWPDEPDAAHAGGHEQYNDYLDDDEGSTFAEYQRFTKKFKKANNGGGNDDDEDVQTPSFSKSGRGPDVTFSLDAAAYGGPYKYGPNAGCVLQPIVRLTTGFTAIRTAIDAMTAVGETNIPLGLMWGWHAISPNTPLADGVAYGTPNTKKVIVLMTDGSNTLNNPARLGEQNGSFYGGLGYINQGVLSGITSASTAAARTAAMDARLTQLCTNIKAQGITIYTVRVEVTTGTSAVLKGCATKESMFYDVKDADDLDEAFESIAGSIADLRIAH
ncbi:MAG TPA: hypothetical protein VIO94_08995 [Phenylobacterium sp.]